MSKYRNAIRLLFIAILALPFSAFAANYDVKALIDTDNSRGTGCSVVLPDGNIVTGIDAVLTTSVTVTGTTGTVTAVTRQTCVGGAFGGPVPVDNGWNVGVSPAGDLLIESHLGPNIVTMSNVGTPRFVFTTTSGTLFDTLLQPTTAGGGDIIMPQAARDRAVSTHALRTIVLNGEGSDWAGDVPLANGTDNHPSLRFISVDAYAAANDLYFKFLVHTNPAAPTAHDDLYDLATPGGTLTVSTLGVLTNDNPNGQSISAIKVDNPQHGTVVLDANGGFVYSNDGAHVPQDQFHYFANGNLPSNTATVTISLAGTKYTFTSADHVIFTAGVPSSFTVTVTGKPTPALSEDGALPPGITFVDNGDGTATLSGTAGSGTVGTYPLVLHAEKNKPHQADQPFTLSVVCGSIAVTNPAVNTGTVGTPFSQAFTQSGGSAPITWSKSGALPAGLTFSTSTGVLSGTPTQGGTFPITVTATDPTGCSGIGQLYTLTIVCNSITVTNPAVNSGTVNVAFSQTFTQAGGVGATTFSLFSGTLPTGLALASTGVLSGTPTQTGSFPLVVRATDSNGCTGNSATYTLTIGCQIITVTNPVTNTGTVNIAFSQTFTAGNAIAPVTFSLNSGTLPAGITLNAATGVLSGTPTQTGSFPITIKATDKNSCFGVGTTYTLTIGCQIITVNNPSTNTGTVNTAFSQTFTATNAIGSLSFTTASPLPAGLTLSIGGVLSGTPTQKGTFPITVHVVDANGCSANGSTYSLTIGCQVITVNKPATTTGTVNVPFSQTFTATNAIGTVNFTTASTLPTGITLATNGILSGTPTQSGTFPIVVTATDANTCTGTSTTYNLVIACQVITVNNPATSAGTVNVPFSQSFTSSNTIGAVTYATASTLPMGLTLSGAGVLSGTPTQSGLFPIVVTATDANGCSGSGTTYNLNIACQIITVTNPGTNTGTVNTVFAQTFTAGNTIGTVTFSTASPLPAGLTLSSGGVLSGTPAQTGVFPIVVKATDANGCFGSGGTYTLTIGCQVISVTNPSTTTGTVNTAFSQTFTAGNTVGTVAFTTASTLPAGLSLSTAGVLSGTPTQTGSFNIVVTATDGNGCTGTGATYPLVIGCQTITVTKPVNNSGTVSAPFSETFTSGNTIGTVTYTLNSGSLPAGLSLSSGGIVGGTPTQSGSFPITVKATDANGCFGVSATYTINIACQVIAVSNPATTSSPAGTPLSINFTQVGAIGTATFTSASTLPAGLTLATNGTLSGTPTQGGAFPIVVTVTDSNGCTGTNPVYTLTITCPVITVTNPVTTTGTVNVAFSQTFNQSGGVGTTTFALLSGTLPTGLTLSSAGLLSGTPTQTGSFPLVIRATDANGCTGDGPTYTLVINCQTITVNNPVTTTGTVNTVFGQTFTASNTIGAVSFTTASGLPAGLTLSTGGVLSGTPTQTGSFGIVVTATDANGCTGAGTTYTLVIGCQTISVTNPATTTGTVNAAFSQNFSAGNTVGTVTFTTASTLPAGLTLSTAGVLSGTPTQSGPFGIVVTATDSNGCSGSGATYNLVIACQTITVTKPVNNTGTVNAPFSETFTSGNTIGTVTYTLNTGSLPAGLSLSGAGLLGGTPTQSGSFPITVKATDANGCFGVSATYTISIACQTITVGNPATTSSPAGTPLSISFTQTGATGTATFTTASTLPTGLTLATNGTLSGTPTQGGAFPIVVTVTDSNGCTGTNPAYTLTITCPVITVTNPGVSTGTAGTAFSQTFLQSGGQGTTTFAVNSGSLPAGLSLSSAGVLSGTPTQTGSFPIVVRATDSNGCTGDGPTYTLVIACQTITVTNPVTTTGTVNVAFSQSFGQSGAIGGAAFSLNSGSLPAGLTLSAAGLLSGTPTQSGSFPITVKVTDGNNCTGISPTYTLVIACQTITVTNPSSSTGTIQVALTPAASYTFSAANTVGAVTFTINSGSLPAGVSLSSAGVLSGTPTVTGSFPITVKATDSNTCFGVSPTYTLVIACQTITVTNPAATTATVGTNFSDTFAQTGANGTATFTVNTGTLPNGITLAANGALSGIPTQSGSFAITVKVTDSNACTGISPTYTLVVSCQTITVNNPGTTTGTVGTAFNQTFTQTGGIGTITWSKTGAIPAGMTFHPTTGVLDGTPTASGSFPITVTATDSNNCAGSGALYTLVIACNVITVNSPGVTTGTVDAAFSQSFTQTGANGTATFTLNSGSLPAGFALSTAGLLTGTPGAPGSSTFTVKVTDSNGCTGISPSYTLTIACQTITVNNPGVTTGTVDAAFSQTFTQTGVGTHTPAVFTVNSGSLAGTGLALSSTGVLSGTPSAPGSIVITVKVTDANGCTGISATYTLVIACQTITVTNPGTAIGVVSSAFTQTFTQSGVGTHTPANFTINSGTLPNGLTLSSAGVLSGTPTQTGTFPITVKVTDANGCTGIGATYNLAINPNIGADAYNNLVDNTQAFVTGGATGTPATPAVQLSGLLTANDLPAGGVTVTAGTVATTQGGSVTIQSDGTFIYTPAVHAAAIALDTFTYTGTSNTGGTATPTSANGTVTLNLANRVWYLKDTAPGGGNGQSHSPFNTLAAVQTAAAANDIIFVYAGNTTTTPLSGSLSLQNGAKLWGEAFGLNVNSNALVTAGATKPRIQSTGVSTPAIKVDTSLATAGNRSGVEIRGMDLEATGATSQAINVTSNAGNTTSITIDNDNIRGATSQGINLNQGSTSTFDATVSNTTITSAGNGIQGRTNTAGTMTITTSTNTISVSAGNGVDIATVAGASALHLGLDSNTVTASGSGIVVNGAAAGTTTITNFLSNNISGNTGAGGITITSATFDNGPGGAFQTVSGGATVIGASGNSVGTTGMVLTNVAGDLSFTDLDIFAGAGAGLKASGLAAYTGSAGFQIAVGAGVSNITAAGGPAVDLNNVKGNTLPFVTITSSGSPTTGVALNAFLGTFSAGSGSAISSTSGTGFQVGTSNASITYDGTINVTAGKGVDLTSNNGSTISFTGALTLSTGSNTAFNVTGAGPAATTGGTVSSTNTTSTITTTTGTALNVVNSTIGAGNLKFTSINAGTAASGPADGIVLNNTGASGGLIISGTGSAGTGGTIQKTTSSGILLTSTKGVDLSWMVVKTSSHEGIKGTGVNGFSLAHSTVSNNGATDATNDNGIRLIDATGAVSLNTDAVSASYAHNAWISTTPSSTAAITTLTVTGGSYNSSNQGDGFLISLSNTASIATASFSGVTFASNGSMALNPVCNDNTTMGNGVGAPATGTITVDSCTFTNNGGVGVSFASGGGNGASNMYARFTNNNMQGTNSHALNVVSGATSIGGTMKVLINNNIIGTAGVPQSGSKIGEGIVVTQQGETTMTATITGNTIRGISNPSPNPSFFDGRGIDVEALGPTATGKTASNYPISLTLTGNNVNTESTSGFALFDIYVATDNQGSPTLVNAAIHGNTVPSTAVCDNSCTASTGNIWMQQKVAPSSGTVFTFGAGADASSQIANNNTGTSGKTCSPNVSITTTATPVPIVP